MRSRSSTPSRKGKERASDVEESFEDGSSDSDEDGDAVVQEVGAGRAMSGPSKLDEEDQARAERSKRERPPDQDDLRQVVDISGRTGLKDAENSSVEDDAGGVTDDEDGSKDGQPGGSAEAVAVVQATGQSHSEDEIDSEEDDEDDHEEEVEEEEP